MAKNEIKNYKKYDYISRYESFPYYYDKQNNKYYYGITSFLNNEGSYVIYKTKMGDTYDSIALDNYGSSLLYWVICDYNRVFDCLSPIEVGTELKLPALNSIKFLAR